MMRAKFKVDNLKLFPGHRAEVELSAVVTGSEENKSFWEHTPAGSIKMTLDNSAAISLLIPGREFYIDFTEAT